MDSMKIAIMIVVCFISFLIGYSIKDNNKDNNEKIIKTEKIVAMNKNDLPASGISMEMYSTEKRMLDM